MNAARHLFRILTDWKEEHDDRQSAAQARDLETGAGMGWQMSVLDDLRLVARGLDDLEARGVRVATYRKYYDAWRDMALAFPWGWTDEVAKEAAYPTAALDQLENLADWFDDGTPELDSNGKELLAEALTEAQDTLDHDRSISDSLRAYLNRLMREIRAALDDHFLDARFDYNEAVMRLYTALRTVAAESASEEQQGRWSDLLKKFFYDASVAAVGSAPGTLLALTGITS